MDLRHAEGRRAAAPRSPRGGARRRHDPEGLLRLQHPVERRATGLRRHPFLRAVAPGGAVGRLPAVLRAVPVSPDDAGLQGRRFPTVAARQYRWDSRACAAAAALDARSGAARRAHARRRAERAAAALFEQSAERQELIGRSRLRRAADRQERRQPEENRRADDGHRGEDHVGRLRHRRTATTTPSSRRSLASCERPPRTGIGGSSGTLAATPASSPASPPSTPTMSWRWTET